MKLTYEVALAVHLRVVKEPSTPAQPEYIEGTYRMVERLGRAVEDALRTTPGVTSVHVGLERTPTAWPDYLE